MQWAFGTIPITPIVAEIKSWQAGDPIIGEFTFDSGGVPMRMDLTKCESQENGGYCLEGRLEDGTKATVTTSPGLNKE